MKGSEDNYNIQDKITNKEKKQINQRKKKQEKKKKNKQNNKLNKKQIKQLLKQKHKEYLETNDKEDNLNEEIEYVDYLDEELHKIEKDIENHNKNEDNDKDNIKYLYDKQLLKQYSSILNHFIANHSDKTEINKASEGNNNKKLNNNDEDSDDDDIDGESINSNSSKKQNTIKKFNTKKQKLSLADLKLISSKPEIVENWDTTAPNPLYLVELKAVKNTIPVFKHWTNKSSFLSNKRGITSSRYKLPEYIENTGIAAFRDPETIDSRILKVKAKHKVNPKIGRMEIKYDALYDAFFVHQIKPKLSKLGEIFYEGKEFEEKLKAFQPGRLSDRLKAALGMSDKQENIVPPFIVNMQRYGAPPAYPHLRILGVNCFDARYVTPNLWKKPSIKDNIEFVFRNSNKKNSNNEDYVPHWGDLIDNDNEEENEFNHNGFDNNNEDNDLDLNDDIGVINNTVKGYYNRNSLENNSHNIMKGLGFGESSNSNNMLELD